MARLNGQSGQQRFQKINAVRAMTGLPPISDVRRVVNVESWSASINDMPADEHYLVTATNKILADNPDMSDDDFDDAVTALCEYDSDEAAQ